MAAAAYRTGLWEREGFTVWNGQWYGGHHVPGYSVLFPPLAAWFDPRAVGVAAGLGAVAAFVPLAREAAPSPRAERAAVWLFTSGVVANVVIGRMPFTLGVAFGTAALLAAVRGRLALSAAAALAAALSSPVAGLFLVLIAAAWWLAAEERRWGAPLALALPVVVSGASVALLFPEGGSERFIATAFWPMLAACAAALWLLDRSRRGLWMAGALYVLLLAAAYVVDTPVGQNATRLGTLAGASVLALAARGPRRAVIAVGVVLVWLQWLPAVRAVVEADGDPAARASFHAPLLGFLRDNAAPGDRIEIAFTENHWEAAHVAPAIALARGWERQLDRKVNGLFYFGELTPDRYERWLRREGVRWVALPDATLDFSAEAEGELLRGGLPFLRPAWRSADWQVWELRDAPPPAAGPARVTATGPDRIELVAARPGRVVVRRRYTRYWRLADGPGCVREAAGGWTRIDVAAAGPVRLEARFRLTGSGGCKGVENPSEDRVTGR